MATNWDKALTYSTNLNQLEQQFGSEKIDTLISALFKAGGTFAVSNGRLYTSDFSTIVLGQTLTGWTN